MENQGKKKVKRTQRDYTLAFKLQVIASVESGELTYKQAQVKYGIQGKSTVLVWLRKHGRLNWSIPNLTLVEESPNQKIKELEARLAAAEQRAYQAELKAKMLDTLIDIAEGEFGFEIRKKSLPKQLKESANKKK